MSTPSISGTAIAADALKYKGAGYVYGGAASSPGDWDCSSFVSYVLGRDLGMPLPGGSWGGPGMPPGAHGPVVTDYAAWAATTQVASPAAGDLCCWVGTGTQGHIGIAISGTQMISALNSSQGTTVTGIVGTGPAGSPLVYRRITGVTPGIGTTAASLANQAGVSALLIVGGTLALAAVVIAGGLIVVFLGAARAVQAMKPRE